MTDILEYCAATSENYVGVFAESDSDFGDMYCSYGIISTYYDGWALGIYAALHADLQGSTAAEIYDDATLKAMIDASIDQYICPYDEVCSYFDG